MRIPFLPALILLLLLPTVAMANGPVEQALSSLQDSPELAAAAEPHLRQAHDDGLPLTMLANKAREGAAKRVPAALVGRFLAELVQHLRASREQLPVALRDAATIEALGRARSARCESRELVSVTPIKPIARGGAAAIRRAASLCTDLRTAGLGSSHATRLAVAAVRAGPGHTHLDGTLVLAVRRAGSNETATAIAVMLTQSLNSGRGVKAAVGAALSAIPVGMAPGDSSGSPPGLTNSKASERAGPPAGHASKSQGNGPPTVPPGHGGTPPGQNKAPPGQDK